MRLKTSGERCEDSIGLPKFPAGKYHVRLVGVEDKDVDKDNPSTVFEFEYLAGTVDLPRNAIHKESIFWFGRTDEQTVRNQDKICLLAIKSGCQFQTSDGIPKPTTKESLAAAHAKEEDIEFLWGDVIDPPVQLIIEIDSYTPTEGQNKGKEYRSLASGGVWEIDDKRVADVPKDMSAMQQREAADVF